jgi:hypothetical protein
LQQDSFNSDEWLLCSTLPGTSNKEWIKLAPSSTSWSYLLSPGADRH